MKRPPEPGEPAIIHKTVNTGDVQRLAICPENFNPKILDQMTGMHEKPLAGYRLEAISDQWFYVVRDADDVRLTQNFVRRRGNDLFLDTTIVTDDMEAQEALMIADLEQCAALMLACQWAPAGDRERYEKELHAAMDALLKRMRKPS